VARATIVGPIQAITDVMGLPDSYILPPRYNDAYHLAGDGVAPPVVDWLARRLFEPLLGAADRTAAAAE
ncbi:MAG TPA: hypothetical protein PKZ97_15570, partial [Azospirillaceae bacterium]|nr:hypothetical protein [Azospirillaceae bacterium]